MSGLQDLRESIDRNPPSPQEASGLLKVMQWQADMAVTNDFGERVWLRPLHDRGGKQLGITDCCFQDDPCPRHRAMTSDKGVFRKFEWRRIEEMSVEEMHDEMMDLHDIVCYGIISPNRTARLNTLLAALESVQAAGGSSASPVGTAAFSAHLDHASGVVSKMPVWKQELLGGRSVKPRPAVRPAEAGQGGRRRRGEQLAAVSPSE